MTTDANCFEFAIDIEASLDRVLDFGSERFAGQFYLVLFEAFPELEEFFRGVNMQHQAAMLTMALQVIVQHDRKPRSSSKDYLLVLGSRHRERGVSRDEYEKFERVLLAMLGKFHGDDWHEALAEQWRSAFQNAVDVMEQA